MLGILTSLLFEMNKMRIKVKVIFKKIEVMLIKTKEFYLEHKWFLDCVIKILKVTNLLLLIL